MHILRLADNIFILLVSYQNKHFVLNRDEEDQGTDIEAEQIDNVSVASASSVASQATVTPENVSSNSAPAGRQSIAPSPLKRSQTVSVSSVQQVSFNGDSKTTQTVDFYYNIHVDKYTYSQSRLKG